MTNEYIHIDEVQKVKDTITDLSVLESLFSQCNDNIKKSKIVSETDKLKLSKMQTELKELEDSYDKLLGRLESIQECPECGKNTHIGLNGKHRVISHCECDEYSNVILCKTCGGFDCNESC